MKTSLTLDILFEIAWDFGYWLRIHQSERLRCPDARLSLYYPQGRAGANQYHLITFLRRVPPAQRRLVGARIRRAMEVAGKFNPIPSRLRAVAA